MGNQMLKTWIISTGTEILQGLYADTNAQWLSRRFNEIGLEVHRHMAVPDKPDLLKFALLHAVDSADLVVISGGLGPTRDDVNRDVIAEVWRLNLSENAEALRNISDRYSRCGQVLSDAGRRQAWVPESAMILQNDHGTAPGFFIPGESCRFSGAALLALPGPPRELQPMFDLKAVSLLREHLDGWVVLHKAVFTILGYPESAINDRLHHPDDDDQNDVGITLLSNPGRVDIRLIIKASDASNLERLRAEWRRKVHDRVGVENIFCEDNEIPGSVIGDLLREQGGTLAVAESCTGGMLSSMLTGAPGASDWFQGGIVSYDNLVKCDQLGVPRDMLNAFGAVSPEVARAMAEGVCRACSADWGLGITGIAGPDGGSLEKPVGLVYLSLAGSNSATIVRQHKFGGDRDMVRQQAMSGSLDLLRRSLKGMPLDKHLP